MTLFEDILVLIMYPYFRTFSTLVKSRFQPKITIKDKSIVQMRVWLSDIDVFIELNNGRHLTLMDLGRFDLGYRLGLFKVLREQKWGLMVAGNFTRYRRRLMLFQRFNMETELVGYDDKWYYFYQKTVRNNIIHSSALIRTAVISKKGIVPAQEVAKAMGIEFEPGIPSWVEDWIKLNETSPSLNPQ